MTVQAPRTLALSLAASAVAAAIGGGGARKAKDVYGRLDKPSWAPPAGAFGPVWSVLYALIGLAGWRLARTRHPRVPLALHGAQLALNAAWPWAFFGARRRRTSLAVIAGLDAAVVAEVAVAARRDPVAAGLLMPYLGWSAYATALNATVSDPGR